MQEESPLDRWPRSTYPGRGHVKKHAGWGGVTAFVNSDVTGVILASVPGVLVALLTYYLRILSEVRQRRQLAENAAALLSLELTRNQESLATFWREINALDKEGAAPGSEEHLAGMASGGLLARVLPHWSFVRWERMPSEALAALNTKALAQIDSIYSDLRVITDLYTQLVTLQPDEREELNKDRFWYNRFAWMHSGYFAQLTPIVERVLAVRNPLA
jgi:hypothetical protein